MSERRQLRARVIGVPAPGVAVWRVEGQPEVAGDLDPAPELVAVGDELVLDVVRDRFRWLVEELVDHLPDRRPSSTERRRAPHAHPARPAGTVLIAWLPFTREGDEAPGKHRPCVVLHSPDPTTVRVRPLFDHRSAAASRPGAVPLRSWRAAGLDKPSVAGPATDVPVEHCEQTKGALLPHDRASLGITR